MNLESDNHVITIHVETQDPDHLSTLKNAIDANYPVIKHLFDEWDDVTNKRRLLSLAQKTYHPENRLSIRTRHIEKETARAHTLNKFENMVHGQMESLKKARMRIDGRIRDRKRLEESIHTKLQQSYPEQFTPKKLHRLQHNHRRVYQRFQ